MPVLQGDQPAGDIIGGLLGAAGAFIGGQQQAKQQKAEQARQAALDAQSVSEAMQRHAEEQQRLSIEQTRADTGQVDALTKAKQEAATELHQHYLDDLARIKAETAQHKDAQEFQLKKQKLDNDLKLGLAKIHGSKDVAEVHANASIAVAQIHASATVTSAEIRASHAGRGRGAGENTGGLSEKGQQFLQMLSGTNNAADPREAKAALDQSGLSAADKGIIEGVLAGKGKGQYVTPTYKPATPRASTGLATTLRAKFKAAQAANPGLTNDQLRQAAKQDGYPDAVIDSILPGGK